jgi:hypothetical protein
MENTGMESMEMLIAVIGRDQVGWTMDFLFSNFSVFYTLSTRSKYCFYNYKDK